MIISMLLTVLVLVVLFFSGFINILFFFPINKFYAWLGSAFSGNSSNRWSASTEEKLVHTKAELEKVFATFDKNGDGFVTKEELMESFKSIGIFMVDKEIDEVVMGFDANGDGLIDFEEFCLLSESMDGTNGGKGKGEKEGSKREYGIGEEENLKEAFAVFDTNRDGLISVEELRLVLSSLGLKEGMKIEDCKEMIRKVDVDGDGMVNFSEFKRMMEGKLVLAS